MRDFQVEHDKRMHLIVVRRDLTGFAHLHPTMSSTGMWSVPLTLPQAGSYRVFADFKRAGRNHTLARDLKVPGSAQTVALAPAKPTATTTGGYTVAIDAATPTAGSETMLSFAVSRAGRPITPEPYLGARGHLVALREGDLAYLHVHPTEDEHETKAGEHETKAGEHDASVGFASTFPSVGRYRLFLQFRHRGRVRTAAFTQEVTR